MTLHRSNFDANPEHWNALKHHALKMPHLNVTNSYIQAWTTYKAATTPADSADDRFEKFFQWPLPKWQGSMDSLYKTQNDSTYDAVTFAVLFGRLAKRTPHRVRKVRVSRRNYWVILDSEEKFKTQGEAL